MALRSAGLRSDGAPRRIQRVSAHRRCRCPVRADNLNARPGLLEFRYLLGQRAASNSTVRAKGRQNDHP